MQFLEEYFYIFRSYIFQIKSSVIQDIIRID